MEDITSEIKEAIEKLHRNELASFLTLKLKEAREAARQVPNDTSIAPWLQTSNEKITYDNLCFFIEMTQHIKLSISDCERDIRKGIQDRAKLIKEEENSIKYLESLRENFIQSLLRMIKCISNGGPFNNIDNELVYQIYDRLKKEDTPTTEEIDRMLSTLNYTPKSIAGSLARPFILEGEYENYATAKKNAIKIHDEIKSNNVQKKIKELESLQNKIIELEKTPQIKNEIIIDWRKKSRICFKINYTDDELNFRPSLLTYF